MTMQRQPKPTIDAVNDAVGALSDLLHSLRAHAKEAAREAKEKASDVGRDASAMGRRAAKKGKTVIRKVEARGEGLLDKAAKVWGDLTGSEGAPDSGRGTAVSKRAGPSRQRAPRRATK